MIFKNWGFTCLFFDSKFNRLISNNYDRLDTITGNFHMFTFVDPSPRIVNARIKMLKDRYMVGDICLSDFSDLKHELEMVKLKRVKAQDIDSEREIMRQELLRVYDGEIDILDEIDIVVFDLKAISDESDFVDVHVISTSFKENDIEGMMRFIKKLSEFSREVHLSDNEVDYNDFIKKIKFEGMKIAGVKVIGGLLRTIMNLKSLI